MTTNYIEDIDSSNTNYIEGRDSLDLKPHLDEDDFEDYLNIINKQLIIMIIIKIFNHQILKKVASVRNNSNS